MVEEKYSYQRFGSEGKRVGQAALDIISSEQPETTVEEILEEFGKDYLEDIQKCADENKSKFDGKFFIFSLLNKDLGQFGLSNVVRHWKIPRYTAPNPMQMMADYQNHTKTLFEVDPKKGEINLLWTLPSYEECKSVLKNSELYDPELVKWIRTVVDEKKI